jgi:hypothetical protein
VCIEQQLQGCYMAILCRHVQSRGTPSINSISCSLSVKQQLHYFSVSFAGCIVQGCAVINTSSIHCCVCAQQQLHHCCMATA